MRRVSILVLASITAIAAGAGGLSSCAAEPSPPSTWADMDHDQRLSYMSSTVEPTMRELFQGYDPALYSDFGCVTCHGLDAVEREYAMPNGLFALPLEGTLDAARARDGAMTDFMLSDAFPTFVDLIDETKFAHEEDPDGYRCTGCHAIAE